ncbi:MAG: outer membrane protein assembly factor BamE [Gammaproteobacteria bacterium]|nr:outer membrane protein assembly factor BamE [Gammaproteobacteria bacterium]
MKFARTLIWLLAAHLLAGCALVTPYKVPVQQGRLIDATEIAKLKPGMTHDQVSYVLGTPGIQDPFHPEQWNYAYTYQAKKDPMIQKQLTLTFKDGKLVSIEGNYPAHP